jgi:hypothetical protein
MTKPNDEKLADATLAPVDPISEANAEAQAEAKADAIAAIPTAEELEKAQATVAAGRLSEAQLDPEAVLAREPKDVGIAAEPPSK